jgi:hypothetical protein
MAKLELLGLGVYEVEMAHLKDIAEKYTTDGTEFQECIPLPGSKRTMVIRFVNSCKHPISINLKYDANV